MQTGCGEAMQGRSAGAGPHCPLPGGAQGPAFRRLPRKVHASGEAASLPDGHGAILQGRAAGRGTHYRMSEAARGGALGRMQGQAATRTRWGEKVIGGQFFSLDSQFSISMLEGKFWSTSFLAVSAPATGKPFGSSTPICASTDAWSQ